MLNRRLIAIGILLYGLPACGGATVADVDGVPDAGGGATGGGGAAGAGGTTGTGGVAPGGSGGAAVGGGGVAGAGGAGGAMCFDQDRDGVDTCNNDCDDVDPSTYPGAPEICGDGVDNACGNNPDPTAKCKSLGTYVSALVGNDVNPGTKTLPRRTIGAGMANAVALAGAQPVFVAEGRYTENVTLVEGVDLLGGHSCAAAGSCDWTRDPAKHVSTIVNQDADGIYGGHGISRATLVEGFTIQGQSGSAGMLYAALTIQGGPTIKGNAILGGAVTNCSYPCGSRAVNVTGAPSGNAGLLLEGNLIVGGDSSANTIGVDITNGGQAQIVGNDIKGGRGDWTRCIAVAGNAGPVEVLNNDLHAGDCAGNGTTFVLYLAQGVRPRIDSNRMNADPNKAGSCPGFSGNWWTGGIESEGSQAVLTNNVIRGVSSPRSTAVMLADCEGACQIGQAIVNGNTLDGAGTAGNGTISAALVFKTWKQGQNVVVGRVRNNILLGGAGQRSYGGYEDVGVQGSQSRPQVFANNDLFGATTLYFQWNGAIGLGHTTIAAVNASVNGASANLAQDPRVDATYHLKAGSPCIDAGTRSGNETPTRDIDGDNRPAGQEVDIGADEAN